MPDFHTSHTFKHHTLISLNFDFPTLISEFYALVHKHLQLSSVKSDLQPQSIVDP